MDTKPGVFYQIDARTVNGLIYINARSQQYRAAEKGDAIALAAVLAHEVCHIRRGAAEIPAYEEELRILERQGASRRAINHVRRAQARAREALAAAGSLRAR